MHLPTSYSKEKGPVYKPISQPGLGKRIKESRKASGLTQRQLGERLGVSYQTIAYWEKDSRVPTLDHLTHLARELDKPDDFFLCNAQEEETNTALQLLCDRLRYYRSKRNLSQIKLAELAGIPFLEIVAYENPDGGKFITEEHLECLCNALGVERDDLLGCSHTEEDLLEMNRKYSRDRILAALGELNSVGLEKAVERLEELSEIGHYCV